MALLAQNADHASAQVTCATDHENHLAHRRPPS
jgi:hypothetical protein